MEREKSATRPQPEEGQIVLSDKRGQEKLSSRTGFDQPRGGPLTGLLRAAIQGARFGGIQNGWLEAPGARSSVSEKEATTKLEEAPT